jgi:hypothetical protein
MQRPMSSQTTIFKINYICYLKQIGNIPLAPILLRKVVIQKQDYKKQEYKKQGFVHLLILD